MNLSSMLKKWRLIILSIIIGCALSACVIGDSSSWKEEVLLHDGKIITVYRSQTNGGYSELASTERSVANEKWVFHIPGSNQEVVWKSDFSRPPKGDSLILLQLNFLNGVPYVATSPAGCLSYNNWKRPNPPYIFFKYVDKNWKQIPIYMFPVVFKDSNVYIGKPIKAERKGLLSVAHIIQEHTLLEPYLRSVIRNPLKPGSIGISCPELVRVDDGWVSPGGAKAPIPINPNKLPE